jgi:hypothetical protein
MHWSQPAGRSPGRGLEIGAVSSPFSDRIADDHLTLFQLSHRDLLIRDFYAANMHFPIRPNQKYGFSRKGNHFVWEENLRARDARVF